MASRQVGSNPGGTRKGPKDFTGKQKEALEAEAAEKLALRAEQMSMTASVQAVKNSEVIDFTDEARREEREERERRAAEEAEAQVEVKPRKHKVRVLADIDDMVFGREVIDPGDFTDPDNIRYPEVGPLRFFSFKEGREYLVDDDLYFHLKALDYIWD